MSQGSKLQKKASAKKPYSRKGKPEKRKLKSKIKTDSSFESDLRRKLNK